MDMYTTLKLIFPNCSDDDIEEKTAALEEVGISETNELQYLVDSMLYNRPEFKTAERLKLIKLVENKYPAEYASNKNKLNELKNLRVLEAKAAMFNSWNEKNNLLKKVEEEEKELKVLETSKWEIERMEADINEQFGLVEGLGALVAGLGIILASEPLATLIALIFQVIALVASVAAVPIGLTTTIVIYYFYRNRSYDKFHENKMSKLLKVQENISKIALNLKEKKEKLKEINEICDLQNKIFEDENVEFTMPD